MSNQQTTLAPIMLTTKWPKNHKLRMPKKKWLKYYEVEKKDFESILTKTTETIQEVLNKEPRYVAAWSGGKDGAVVLNKLYKSDRLDSVFYIKTNTGVQPTEDFIKDHCNSLGVKLHIREPTPLAFAYVALVLEIGFPGPALHDMTMNVLKYKTMFKFITEPQFKSKHTFPVLGSGVRKFESQRRKFNYMHPINCDSGKLWFTNPEFYTSDEEIYKYFIVNGLKRSPSYGVWDSGMECECGTFASHGEMDAIRKIDPKRAKFFEDLTEFARNHGTPMAKKHLDWGGQSWTDEEVNDVITKWFGEEEIEHIQQVSNMICGSECGPGTMKGMYNY